MHLVSPFILFIAGLSLVDGEPIVLLLMEGGLALWVLFISIDWLSCQDRSLVVVDSGRVEHVAMRSLALMNSRRVVSHVDVVIKFSLS